MDFQKLRLGILLDSYNIPAWIYSAVKRISDGNFADFVLVVLNGNPDKRGSPFDGPLMYSLFHRIDERLLSKQPNPFALKSATDLLSGVPAITVYPTQMNGIRMLQPSDLSKITSYGLDILIKIGFESLACEDLRASKYGTWFYYYGDDRKMKGGPPGFWEVIEKSPETCAGLLASGGELCLNRALYRSYFFTYPLSPARHRSYYFWATASFLPRQIELLQHLGAEEFLRQTDKFNLPDECARKKYEPPSGLQTAKLTARLVGRLWGDFIRRLFYADRWILLFSLDQDLSADLSKYKRLQPPQDKFWADPHVVHAEGKYYIFVEEYSHTKHKGHISVIEMDEQGNCQAPVTILERDYHLSYPYVFEWDGRFYMVPESGSNKSIDLYECVEFPYRWEFKQSLMRNVKAVDSTMIFHAQKWWLFTAIAENEAAAPNYELFLFYTDDLFAGRWIAHQQNPIVSDVRSARPAGSLIKKDGKLFRPSQDCTRAYGYGFDLNEIVTLSETDYVECRTLSIRPGWDKDILATHTFATAGNLTMIDAFTCRRKLPGSSSLQVM